MFNKKLKNKKQGSNTNSDNLGLWQLYKKHMHLLHDIYPTAFKAYMILGVAAFLFYPFSIAFSAKFINSVVSYYNKPVEIYLLAWNLPLPVYYASLWFGIWVLWRVVTFLRDMYEELLWVAVYHGGVYKFILRKFYSLNLEEIQENQVFDALSRFSQYWFAQARTIHKGTVKFLGAIISLILTFFVMVNEKGHYGLGEYVAAATLLPLVSSIVLLIQDKLYRNFVEKETNQFRLRDYLISILLDSKTFLEKKINNIYNKLINHYLKLEEHIVIDKKINWSRHDIIVGIFDTFEYYLFVLLRILFVGVSISNRVKVGTITGNLTFLNNIYTKIKSLLNNWTSVVASLRYTRDLFNILSLQGFADRNGYKISKASIGASQKLQYSQLNNPRTRLIEKSKNYFLEFRNLSFKFPDSDYILKNSSMKLELGQSVFIYGKDGTGKSALVKILTASFKLPLQSYFIKGVPVENYRRNEVKKQFSFAGEYFDRYFISLKENVMLGNNSDNVDMERYKQALQIADLYKWAEKGKLLHSKRPLGKFFAEGTALPSGMWQRVAIARAIYLDRPVILCDMCFTYIDQEARNDIIRNMLKYIKSHDKLLIFITEDLDFVNKFDLLFIKTKEHLYKINQDKLVSRTDVL